MNALVTQLYKNGKPIPREGKVHVHSGCLAVFDHFNNIVLRCVVTSHLLRDDGSHIIPIMTDVRLITTTADGFMLRGIEQGRFGVEYAQEWYVRPVLVK